MARSLFSAASNLFIKFALNLLLSAWMGIPNHASDRLDVMHGRQVVYIGLQHTVSENSGQTVPGESLNVP
jgi:hypothetical protein